MKRKVLFPMLCIAFMMCLAQPALAANSKKAKPTFTAYSQKLALRLNDITTTYWKAKIKPYSVKGTASYAAGLARYREDVACIEDRMYQGQTSHTMPIDINGSYYLINQSFIARSLGEFILRRSLYERMDMLTKIIGVTGKEVDLDALGQWYYPLSNADFQTIGSTYLLALDARKNIYSPAHTACQLWDLWASKGYPVKGKALNDIIYPRTENALYTGPMLSYWEWLNSKNIPRSVRLTPLENVLDPMTVNRPIGLYELEDEEE